MKKLHFEFLLALSYLAVFTSASGQNAVWLQQYGNEDRNTGLRLAEGPVGTLFGVGRASAPSLGLGDVTVSVEGSEDILIVRWDSSGQVIWAKTAGGTCWPLEDESGSHIIYDANAVQLLVGGHFICAETHFDSHVINGSGGSSSGDMFLAAYDVSGTCSWARGVRGFDVQFASILVDAASSVFVVGSANTAGAIFQDDPLITLPTGGFIAKYDQNGGIVHVERALVNGELNRAFWADQSTWVLAGKAKSNADLFGQSISTSSTAGNGFVANADTAGTVNWVTTFPSSGLSLVYFCDALPGGRSAVAGAFVEDLILPNETLTGPVGELTFFLAVLDGDGEIEWTKKIIGTQFESINDLKVDGNGDILLYGRFEGHLMLGERLLAASSSYSGFVARFSDDGSCKSAWSFGRVSSSSGSILPADHGLYLSTPFDSTLVFGSYTIQSSYTGEGIGVNDLMLARIDSISGFTGVQSFAPEGESGLHIYANPSNGLCTVELPDAITPGSDLVLRIYDLQGRVVQQAPLLIQHGTVQLDIQAQAKGIYHVELQDGNRRYAGRIVFE
jgi:hypothetical protein